MNQRLLAGVTGLLAVCAACAYGQDKALTVNVEDWRQVSSPGPTSSFAHFVDFASIRGTFPNLSYLRRQGRNVGAIQVHGYGTRIVEVDCSRETSRDRRDFDAEYVDEPRPAADFGFAYVDELKNVCEWAKTRVHSQSAANAGPRSTPPPGAQLPEKGRTPSHSSGSGFVVGAKLVITNNHVIDRCSRVTVRQGDELIDVAVKAAASSSDLALLALERPLGTSSIVRASAILGEDVMAAGHPLAGLLSNDIVVTSGQVNSLAGILNDPSLFQFSAPIQPGNSGGPLIDRSGSVVGVVVSKVNALRLEKFTGDMAQNVNFAIKPEVLRLFLDTNRVIYQSASLGKKLENFELADRARRITVQVVCEK